MKKTTKTVTRTLAGAAAFMVAGVLTAPVANAAAQLNVSQTEGLKDGTVVTISGTGFKANMPKIAIGQCIEGMKGPADCNMGGGSQFKPTDANGNIAEFTLVMKEKFSTFDCTTQQCVIGAQPLPGEYPDDVVAANTVYFDLSFGEVAAPAPAEPTESAAPNTGGEELPNTGPGEELALALGLGVALVVGGGLVLSRTSRRAGGVA